MNTTPTKNTGGGSQDKPNSPNSKSHERKPPVQPGNPKDDDQAIISDEDVDSDDINSDEYDFVEREVQDPSGIHSTPTYHFPATWDNAYHSTTTALRDVSSASSSYYHALASSGLSKAGWSIGGALAATANRSALSVASLAVAAAGADENRLPRGVRNWLKGKEELDAAKKRAEKAEKARLARKYKRELVESGGLVEIEPGVYVDPESSRSGAGSMVSRRGSERTV